MGYSFVKGFWSLKNPNVDGPSVCFQVPGFKGFKSFRDKQYGQEVQFASLYNDGPRGPLNAWIVGLLGLERSWKQPEVAP